MTLQLVNKEDCSSIENQGIRKLDRRDRLRLMVEKRLKHEKDFKSEFKDVVGHRDVYIDPKFGIIRIKKAKYYARGYWTGWMFHFYKNDKKQFDHLECRCLNEKGNAVKKYIIPRDAIKTKHFSISDIRYRKQQIDVKKWYDEYEVDELNNWTMKAKHDFSNPLPQSPLPESNYYLCNKTATKT